MAVGEGTHPAEPAAPHTLGPDGKPCKACTHSSSMLRAFSKMYRADKSDQAAPAVTSSSSTPEPDRGNETRHSSATSGVAEAGDEASTSGTSTEAPIPECPPDGTEIGRAAWTFLHSMAAYYPEKPSQPQQRRMREFIRALGEFYPCEVCAEHFQKEAKRDPPDVKDNMSLSLWFCRMHNKVNEVLGKPIFDCSKVLERWKDGPADGSCD
jgi:mitochondrial FAD-linked sulfhydryl oxidase